MEQKVIYVDRNVDTYLTLLQESFRVFKIVENKDNYRLRAYNVHNKILMETYTGLEDQTLE